ncbi:endonuclease/exonuclease/phosphatase family protein [Nibrella saemangeumensis]|uniref:Endonuclease/exonuclease/phosphatase family protein n=1 Tax=Nibrella saemangeumensis TaxID=1084526 RepID=A0ABP8NR58_9BACT
MKLYLLPALLMLFSGIAPAQQNRPLPLNILSFNIRYNNPQDGLNAWPNRKEMAAKVFTDYQVDFAGLQEALAGQIYDLQQQLPQYAWIGVGRDDGKTKGEFSPIFYNKDKFEVLTQGTFWLSETPDVPGSKNWDAAITRVATYGQFREKRSGRKLFVINTHYDHIGEQARQNSSRLLIRKIKELSAGLPVILTGDFNSPEASPAIQTLTTDANFRLINTERLSEEAHTGGTASFNGFGKGKPGPAIDFILVGPAISVKRHDYLPIVNGEVYVSDHWPVISRVSVER